MPFPTSGLSSLEPSVVKWNGIRYITSFLTSLVLSVLYEMRKEVQIGWRNKTINPLQSFPFGLRSVPSLLPQGILALGWHLPQIL